MSKFKKRLSVILVATILLSTISIGIIPSAEAVDILNYSNTTNDTPLSIEVTTDKSSYSTYGIAQITVNVTNTSNETVNNISAEAVFDDLAPVGKNSETFKEIESLKSGESFSFSYKATLNANKVKINFFEKIILWFVRLFNGGYNATENNFDNSKDYISITDVIDFSKYSANNEIKVWYEYTPQSIISRGNWILMLSDILEWESKTTTVNLEEINCFNDISGKECENAVKYASTLGLFDSTAGQFSPDSPATREFVAVTTVRALNFYETENIDCLDKSQIQHPKEVYTAISIEILQIENNYFYPNKAISANQITNVLEKISDILNSTIINENHQNEINYTDKVIELSDNVDYQQNGTNFEFSVSTETEKLNVGSIFVLPDYTSYKITSINQTNGKYIVETEQATIEETLNSIDIEGTENISSGSFIPAEGVEIVQPRATRSAITMENINLKVEKEVEQDIFLYAELSIKDPRVEYKIDIDWSEIMPNINNVYLKFIFDMEVKGGFKDSDSGKTAPSKAGGISLGKYPVVGALGTGIYIEISLEYSIDGKIELVMTIHGETGIQIYKNHPRGISELSPNFDFPSLEANAKFGPKISGLLCIIKKWDLIDFSLYAGAATKSSLKIRDTGINCLSVHGYAFAELQALKKGVLGKWLNLEYDWKIWNEENSCLKKQWHFENLIFVPKCTYGDEIVQFVNVSGTIKDSVTNEPIEGATIYCEEMGTSCVTDKNGRYTIAIKSFSVQQTFEVTHKDYNRKGITVASNSYSLIEEITLDPKENTQPETNQPTLSGIVKDEITGNPISGVTVDFVDNSSDSLEPIATATTDVNGWFSVELPQGDYSLSFNHENYKYHGISLTVDSDYVALNDPILLTRKTVSITGTVEDKETNNPISGVTVEVVDNESNSLEPLATATTDENGKFTIKIPYGDTSLSFKHNSYEYYGKSLTINSDNYLLKIMNFNNHPISLTPKSEDNRTVIDSGECGADGDNVIWTLYDDGELIISGSGAMADYPSLDAPWYSIREYITNVIINSGVTSIGDYAFFTCYNITSVTIPNSVTNIGAQAFLGIFSLTSIVIPKGVLSIEKYAFSHCINLANIIVYDSVKTIDEGAFNSCVRLTSVYYTGTKEQWNNITINTYNSDLLNATIHYNS